MATQSRGAPYPLGTDPNNTAADLQALALWVNDRPGVSPLTTTQINALSGIERWDGRLVEDTTVDRLKRWDAGSTTWVTIPDSADIGALLATTGLPAALGDTASRGVSSSAARADHIHAWPAPAAWTPTIAGGGVIGNGVLDGRYHLLGKTCHFWGRLTVGSTTTQTGVYVFNVPFTGAAAHAGSGWNMSAEVFDVSSSSGFELVCRMNNQTNVSIYTKTANGALTGAAYPHAPQSAGDILIWRGSYEIA